MFAHYQSLEAIPGGSNTLIDAASVTSSLESMCTTRICRASIREVDKTACLQSVGQGALSEDLPFLARHCQLHDALYEHLLCFIVFSSVEVRRGKGRNLLCYQGVDFDEYKEVGEQKPASCSAWIGQEGRGGMLGLGLLTLTSLAVAATFQWKGSPTGSPRGRCRVGVAHPII